MEPNNLMHHPSKVPTAASTAETKKAFQVLSVVLVALCMEAVCRVCATDY